MNYKSVCDDLLDMLCDMHGVVNTARFLLEVGYDYDDLIELKFDTDVIEQASVADMNGYDLDWYLQLSKYNKRQRTLWYIFRHGGREDFSTPCSNWP